MSRIYYKAISPDGQFKKGYIENSTCAHVHHTLTNRHYMVLSCSSSGWHAFKKWHQGLPLLELAEICFHLAAFDEAGLSLVDGLDQVNNLCRKRALSFCLSSITQDVKQGRSLSQAFEQQPLLNNRTLVSLLQVGEKVGSFHPYLKQAEQSFRWENDLKQSVQQALIYPFILLLFLSILIFITVTVLVPNLQTHLKLMGGSLSSPLTESLIGLSNFFHHYGAPLGVGLLFLMGGIWILKKFFTRVDLWISQHLLSIPYFGPLKAQLIYLRFFQELSIMLFNDLDLLPSLQQATKNCSNKWLQQKFHALETLFLKGHSFSEALKQLPHLPTFLLKYAQLGEKTGNLATILEKACQHDLVRLKKQLIRLTNWIQPTLVILMGSILIWIILAILVPLYDTISHIDF